MVSGSEVVVSLTGHVTDGVSCLAISPDCLCIVISLRLNQLHSLSVGHNQQWWSLTCCKAIVGILSWGPSPLMGQGSHPVQMTKQSGYEMLLLVIQFLYSPGT